MGVTTDVTTRELEIIKTVNTNTIREVITIDY